MSGALRLEVSRPEKDVVMIECRGEFAGMDVLGDEPKIIEAINASANGIKVVFDFSGVSYIDSAGVGVLYKCVKQGQPRKIRIMLMRPNSDIKKILVTAAIPKVLDVLD